MFIIPQPPHFRPIYETNEPNAHEGKVVGISLVIIRWESFMESLLINDYSDIYLVIESSCPSDLDRQENLITFRIGADGNVETLSSVADMHDKRYDYLKQSRDLVDLDIDISKVPDGLCVPKVSMSF